MARARIAALAGEHWIRPGESKLDLEFRDLLPGLISEEHKLRQWQLALEEYRETLPVWLCQGQRILLVGYEIFAYLKQRGEQIRIVDMEFATRQAARQFILQAMLARGHWSPLAISYFRGQYCLDRQYGHGGDRRSLALKLHRVTEFPLDELAEFFGVSLTTPRRDVALALAVGKIDAQNRFTARRLLLAPGAGLTRGLFLRLAAMPLERQQEAIAILDIQGRLPRTWWASGPAATMTVPREPVSLAETLLRRLGEEQGVVILEHLAKVLGRPRAGPSVNREAAERTRSAQEVPGRGQPSTTEPESSNGKEEVGQPFQANSGFLS